LYESSVNTFKAGYKSSNGIERRGLFVLLYNWNILEHCVFYINNKMHTLIMEANTVSRLKLKTKEKDLLD